MGNLSLPIFILGGYLHTKQYCKQSKLIVMTTKRNSTRTSAFWPWWL
jgi:hypothetical protein